MKNNIKHRQITVNPFTRTNTVEGRNLKFPEFPKDKLKHFLNSRNYHIEQKASVNIVISCSTR